MPHPLPDRLLPFVSAVRLALRLLGVALAVRMPAPSMSRPAKPSTR
jgi:hypothetical protein